jgi:hypothetical protein
MKTTRSILLSLTWIVPAAVAGLGFVPGCGSGTEASLGDDTLVQGMGRGGCKRTNSCTPTPTTPPPVDAGSDVVVTVDATPPPPSGPDMGTGQDAPDVPAQAVTPNIAPLSKTEGGYSGMATDGTGALASGTDYDCYKITLAPGQRLAISLGWDPTTWTYPLGAPAPGTLGAQSYAMAVDTYPLTGSFVTPPNGLNIADATHTGVSLGIGTSTGGDLAYCIRNGYYLPPGGGVDAAWVGQATPFNTVGYPHSTDIDQVAASFGSYHLDVFTY